MATHSGVLARRIPWTKELSGLSPWGHKESDTPERLTYPLISQSAAPYLPTLPKTPASRQVGCLSLEQQFLSSFLKLNASCGQNIGASASASVLPMNTQD